MKDQSSKRHLVVAGGYGVVGTGVVSYFSNRDDWRLTTVGRSEVPQQLWNGNIAPAHIRADLQEAEGVREAFGNLRDATALVFCAYVEKESMAATVAPNVAMLRNAIDGLMAAGAPLQHVVLIGGGKSYGEHLGFYKTPAKERDPRMMGPIFYNDQEDLLWERAARHGFTWTILRPDAVWGPSVGSPMNLMMGVAAFAAVSKELKLPLRFPGGPAAWKILFQITDAGLLAEAIAWALTSDTARGEIFNVTNGDLFRWEQMWTSIADYFQMETAPPQPMSLTEQMRDKGDLWQQMVKRYGLVPTPWERLVAWPFTEGCLNIGFDLVQSTVKIRQAGFHACVDSHDSVIASFEDLQRHRIIP